jgi:RimJ/RimL family protein N-acetyltransferase
MEAPVIATQRLALEPLGPGHAEEMATVLADAALHTFIGGEPLSSDELRRQYARLVKGSGQPDVSWLNWVLRWRSDGRLVGTVQATVTIALDGTVRADAAWVIGTDWQGQRYATDAATALTDWLIGSGCSVDRALIHHEHGASAAVAEAAGLRRTDEMVEGEAVWMRVGTSKTEEAET